MAENPTTQILDLGDLSPERPQIAVTHDGERYTYSMPLADEIGLQALARIRDRSKRMQQLQNKLHKDGDITEKEAGDLERVLDELITALVPDMPEEHRRKLDTNRQKQIVYFFIEHNPALMARAEAQNQSTGANTSRGSKGSTAATRKRGSK